MRNATFRTSTNLTQWTTSGSGLFDTSGNFSTTNVFAPQTQTMFYRLQQVMVPLIGFDDRSEGTGANRFSSSSRIRKD